MPVAARLSKEALRGGVESGAVFRVSDGSTSEVMWMLGLEELVSSFGRTGNCFVSASSELTWVRCYKQLHKVIIGPITL